jgi:hypothetical protein
VREPDRQLIHTPFDLVAGEFRRQFEPDGHRAVYPGKKPEVNGSSNRHPLRSGHKIEASFSSISGQKSGFPPLDEYLSTSIVNLSFLYYRPA